MMGPIRSQGDHPAQAGRRAVTVGALVVLAAASACARGGAARLTTIEPPTIDMTVQQGPADGGAARAPDRLQVIDDDLPGAFAQARAQHKLLLVEAWAPWCHTCLSMKHYVLAAPSLAPLAAQVIVVAIDTDKAKNAAFLAQHRVEVWPTLFVLDPEGDHLLARWPGAASVAELRELVEHALALRDAASAPIGADAALLEGQRAQAQGDHAMAAARFERALQRGAPSWPRRSAALLGWLSSLYRQEDWPRCAELGAERVLDITGAAVPTDYCYVLLACAGKLGHSPLARRARARALERLRRHTAAFPPGATADDRADAWSLLARVLGEMGDRDGAREARTQQLAVLEQAAQAAPDAARAATFDYGRMRAYLDLGRADDAIRMLRARIAELPEAYEPRGRLAETLMAVARWPEALEAIDGALQRSYGPRQIRYLRMRADILGRLGRRAERRAALDAVLQANDALPASTRQATWLRTAVDAARAELEAPSPVP